MDRSYGLRDRWGEQWKVLVYDNFCRDIISPILKLHELRKKGVTLHMLLDSDREEIPDVPAIYFVQPTTANLQRIIQDCTKELYSSMHLNFVSPIPRDKLEAFAKGCALVDDMLGIKLNRVAFKVPNDKGTLVDKSQDLDVKSDKFFESTAGMLFPDAIASHEEELKVVLKKEKDISAKAGSGGNSTKELAAAVDTLPALLEMKKTLEVHTNVFQATMDAVTSRQVPEYSMLEQRLIEGFNVPPAEVVALLSEKVLAEDKVRLLMIYYLTTGASSGEIADFEAILRQPMTDSTAALAVFDNAWKFIKQHTSLQKHASVGSSFLATDAPASNATAASKLKGLANNWAGTFAGQAQGWLTQAAEQFKNFLPENKKLQLTRKYDGRANTEDESYLYLDPKIKPGSGQVPRQRTPFRDVIVFVIGGGNYNEYQNLQAYAKAQPSTHPRQILYGCTELLTPNEFLQQLNQVHT
ncbi:hypothetical protein DYB32_004277 [Aphanomyces invadans]|uniref:Sec1 family domain-containing protein 1 n=1 Tax=Aphanomyces invadans TaxID=157072 RepID=A0A3R6WMN5_9STRA|nr:hypothetical protein DYB32_004277 [Aphanomyces invadans]